MRNLFYISLAIALLACNSEPHEEQEDASSLDQITEQTTISIPSTDSIQLSADYYPNQSARKLILMFHQGDFSRGEYQAIAPQLVEAGFACLAVDLRAGRAVNGVVNEAYSQAVEKGLPTSYINARQDMQAAISFAKDHSKKELVLWGSSYSASLALMEGRDDPRVVKVVAFSPVEAFTNQNYVKAGIAGYSKPVMLISTQSEVEVLSDIFNTISDQYATKFQKAADHGSKSLWPEKAGSDSLMMRVIRFL